ncbi:hypothetical protein EVG20_g8926 [Dentipellis fragilis]|uniref:Wax synthase domain-containing protein n=1 Tax=Dentipellis fragilis TaxID=205917 RepID=A0A4Y9Y1U6_9AGAM|nr:hypothetical protein EVG20_g8926 [Dentipellis fragilis]
MADTRPELPVLSYLLLPDILSCILVAFGPPLWVRLLAFCAFFYTKLSGMHYYAVDEPAYNFTFGTLFLQQVLAAAHYMLTTNPVDDVRHERDVFKVSARELPLLKRIYWAAGYCFGPRSVGWSDQVANIPARPRISRWAFVRSHLLWMAWCLFLVDIAQTYQHTHPDLFHRPGETLVSVGADGYIMRCVNVVSTMSTVYAMINVHYSVCAIAAVSLGLSGPADWPNVSGRWADAYTVRKFWGKTWHQMLRRSLSSPGRLISRTLGFKRGTTASSYTQLYVAFILSGIQHSGGDYMADPALWRQSFTANPLFYQSFTFFFSQAVAITAEDAMIWVGRKLGLQESRATHLLGYASTFCLV